jgi:hypothetical protein
MAASGRNGKMAPGRKSRQSTIAAAGGIACGGVKNYSATEVDSLL